MAKCKLCGKGTAGNFCCPAHSQTWYTINFPDHTCLFCGAQLYPQGTSHKNYLKSLYCGHPHRSSFLKLGFKAIKPFKEVGEFEVVVVTIANFDYKIQLVENLIGRNFYCYVLNVQKNEIIKTQVYGKRHVCIKEAIDGLKQW